MKILSDRSLPLLANVYDQLNIGKKIDEVVQWDKDKCMLSPGQASKALILNILTDRKPLYRIQDFYADKDIERLMGKGIDRTHVNEFCIARALVKFMMPELRKYIH